MIDEAKDDSESFIFTLKNPHGTSPSRYTRRVGYSCSITCNNSLVLSTWRKNCIPSPTPSLAPSIIPGISAITKLSPLAVFTTPKFGSIVVKW